MSEDFGTERLVALLAKWIEEDKDDPRCFVGTVEDAWKSLERCALTYAKNHNREDSETFLRTLYDQFQEGRRGHRGNRPINIPTGATRAAYSAIDD